MAGIKAPIQDILAKLATLEVTTADQLSAPLYARIWNNQIEAEDSGELGYNFQKPAAFLEVMNDQQYTDIGGGVQSVDLVFRVHSVTQFFNADGTLEQDLEAFDQRDAIVGLLSGFKATGMGPLYRISETQDYAHKNVYHYIIEFTANFTDTTGQVRRTEFAGPLTLENQITTGSGSDDITGDAPHVPADHRFKINLNHI